MINHSDQISNLSAALLKAQKAIGKALKSAENPYFKSHYADLTAVIDSVKEPLNDNGIAFIQAVDENGEGKPVIDTILLHESGQYLSTRTPVFCNKPNDPQAFGSGVTYSKRYALQAILGLPTEDDDAEAATARGKRPNGNNRQQTPPESTVNITATIKKAFDDLTAEWSADLPDGYMWDEIKFKDELRKIFSKLKKADRDNFDWTKKATKELAKKIKPDKIITESKAA